MELTLEMTLQPLDVGTASLRDKTRDADRVVTVKSAPETPYPLWIKVSQTIEQAGGILTLELESERVINVE